MLTTLGLAAALLSSVTQNPPGSSSVTPRYSIVRDSAPGLDSSKHNRRRRRPVTAEVLRTAFRDEQAKTLYYRARAARLAQDSALRNYDAESRERVSVGMRLGDQGHERVMFRQENVGRVRWQRDVGVRVDILGSRNVIAMNPDGWKNEMQDDIANLTHVPVPYFPGSEPLSFATTPAAREDVNDRGTVHPLAEGAEAYYFFETGDSIRYTLPDRSVIRLRELKVRPRWQDWNLVLGTLMFDIESGVLVRAAFRSVVPMDPWDQAQQSRRDDGQDPKAWLFAIARGIIPLEVRVTDVTITYSLHAGRFWLPRTKTIRGLQKMAFAQAPVIREQAFTYHSVNAPDLALETIVANAPKALPLALVAPDSLSLQGAAKWRDSVYRKQDSMRTRFRDSLFKTPCDSTGTRTVAGIRANETLPIATTFPCELEKLVESKEFKGSIFEPNEELFGAGERDELVNRVLSLAQQVKFLEGIRPPRYSYGLAMTRYNRVEGLSSGLGIEQTLGGGYAVKVEGRFGLADKEPGGELAFSRSNLRRTYSIGGYHRLVSVSDWGNPLSFGAGMSALVFGRDEGFYHRATGAELKSRRLGTGALRYDWRLFGERQRSAVPEASYSMSGSFIPNIVAAEGWSAGGELRVIGTRGINPVGSRTFADLRLEGAGGDSVYGRAALDVTMTRPMFGSLTTALTLAGGATVGQVPAQRLWYLGGTHTVRGQRLDPTRAGNAFWLSRLELAREVRIVRPSIFGDVGWVGDRTRLGDVGRPLSGAGVGLSFNDGFLRLDVARGIYPSTKTRVDLYLGARF